jgi:hypothetical protein
VWTAPITAGGGTKPAITVTATASADIGAAASEYSGLSAAAGAAAVDQLKTATGTATAAGFVTSGPTPALTGDNGLAVGFYADSGFGRTLSADPSYTERVNVSPRNDMEFVTEDALPLRGDTPAARVSTGSNTPWTMATVVFKSGTVSPPALSVSPTSLAFSGTAGGASPAAKTVAVTNTGGGTLDVTASDDAAWLAVTPASATAPATLTVTPTITGLAAGTYTATVTVTATTGGATGSPKTIAVTLTVSPAGSANLVGAWGFNETTGTTAADSSGLNNPGTITGATHVAAGKFGGALSFNGTSNLVTVADANSLDLTTGMTLEAWIQPTAIGSLWRCVILKEQPNSLIYALYAGDSVGRPAMDVFTNADIGFSGSTALALNTWIHLAATYDGTTQRLFVNGVQVATKATTGAIKVSTGALRIGGDTSWANEWFAGLIDEVRVYNKALTAAEIQADMVKPVN